jgi:hypothetical protein
MDDTIWNTIRIILVVLHEQNPDLLRDLYLAVKLLWLNGNQSNDEPVGWNNFLTLGAALPPPAAHRPVPDL